MHVCCIGKFNIPVFICETHFSFNSNKGKIEGEKKKSAPLLLTLMQLNLKPHSLGETSTQRKDVCVCVCVLVLHPWVFLCVSTALMLSEVWLSYMCEEIHWYFNSCFWWILLPRFTLCSAVISHINTCVTFPLLRSSTRRDMVPFWAKWTASQSPSHLNVYRVKGQGKVNASLPMKNKWLLTWLLKSVEVGK